MRNLVVLFLLLPLHLTAVNVEFVTITDVNNIAASNGKGAVSYEYQISKFEITNSEYCEFLNSVAVTSDVYELFSPLMQEHFFGGIIRERSVDGDYTYKCKDGYADAPVVGLSWMSAIRYVNWLHYNAANIANNVEVDLFFKQTEGNDTHGAYDTRSIPTGRNQNALYWLPNENEWLKAAFYKGNFWEEDFLAEGSNCYTENGWAYPYPHIKAVGRFVQPSYYGTYDQQGNAAEWIENARSDDWKLALGGSLIRPYSFAMFAESEGDFPNKSITTFGIRICRTSDYAKLENAKAEIYSTKTANLLSNPNVKDLCDDEYVLVGNAGNTGDIVNQFKGRVNYDYYIAKTELSNASYCKFLNAVATIDDPYGLYDENMSNGACGGIIRIKCNDRWTYNCKEGYENRPVVYVNYYDIARYANWMHYGCPGGGRCELGVTEGNASQGAYDTSDYELVRDHIKAPYENFGKRNAGARFWIPSDDEWYKAAYHDPEKIGNRKYYDYPTQTSSAPSSDMANYMCDNSFSIGGPLYMAPVDAFSTTPSYYGTLNQGGNVWEWTEDWQYGQVGSRGLRGGSWSYTHYGLNAVNVDPGGLDNSGYVFGARLCMAVSADGWYSVDTPIFIKVYETVLLMPKKCLILAVIALSLIAFVSFIISVAFVIRMLLIRK